MLYHIILYYKVLYYIILYYIIFLTGPPGAPGLAQEHPDDDADAARAQRMIHDSNGNSSHNSQAHNSYWVLTMIPPTICSTKH